MFPHKSIDEKEDFLLLQKIKIKNNVKKLSTFFLKLEHLLKLHLLQARDIVKALHVVGGPPVEELLVGFLQLFLFGVAVCRQIFLQLGVVLVVVLVKLLLLALEGEQLGRVHLLERLDHDRLHDVLEVFVCLVELREDLLQVLHGGGNGLEAAERVEHVGPGRAQLLVLLDKVLGRPDDLFEVGTQGQSTALELLNRRAEHGSVLQALVHGCRELVGLKHARRPLAGHSAT